MRDVCPADYFRAHRVVLPRVSYVQPRHFVTSLLATWGTQTLGFHLTKPRIREIPRSLPPVLLLMDGPDSLRSFATREVEKLLFRTSDARNPDTGDFATRVLPIGRLRFSRYFGTSPFAISRVSLQRFRPFTSRNPEMRFRE
jgi:hypothetical protein